MFDDGDDDEDFSLWVRCGLAQRDTRNCAGPGLVMNIFFISGLESRENSALKVILYIFLHDWDWQKFLDKVGFGHDSGFDGGLPLPEAAGSDFWFEPRSIDDIIVGLCRVGDVIAEKFLEHWKQGPGGELGP